MTIEELQHIIEISGKYDTRVFNQRDEYIDKVRQPLVKAIKANNKAIIDYLIQCTPEELFYVINTITDATKGRKQLELHNKMLKNNEHLGKILDALKKLIDEMSENNVPDENHLFHFDMNADMVEGIHLSSKQIELWDKIMEQERLHIKAREAMETEDILHFN